MEALQGENKVFIIGFTNPGHATEPSNSRNSGRQRLKLLFIGGPYNAIRHTKERH